MRKFLESLQKKLVYLFRGENFVSMYTQSYMYMCVIDQQIQKCFQFLTSPLLSMTGMFIGTNMWEKKQREREKEKEERESRWLKLRSCRLLLRETVNALNIHMYAYTQWL